MLGVPCLTLRTTTERPSTIVHGTNQLVGTQPERIVEGWQRVTAGGVEARVPPLWDGKAAERIVDVLRTVAARTARPPAESATRAGALR